MARIKAEDVATVRDRASLEDVVAEHVTLKASGANLKGLCPFHDEKSPSFQVSPARNLWHCYGCAEGGDVIDFVQRIDGLPFADAVERLADRIGLTLQREDETPQTIAARAAARGQRARLLAIHADAHAFYAAALLAPDGEPGRAFLRERGFDRTAATHFGVGYSPAGWTGLTDHLLAAGHTADDLITAGVAHQGKNGKPYDVFRGRVMWPIRDTSGDIVGFGARRLSADDTGPKYLNTAETPIYRKHRVLYGLDLARRDIVARREIVVVEGYTDVMACHLAGVTTAVATCGTAFGDEHVRVVRRLLDDAQGTTGAIVFTFDGDSAGQKAALRAYEMDSHFQTRTYAAVEPSGLDPCDVRMQRGDAAVVELIADRVPLFRFVLTTTLSAHDLSTPEGRVNALAACAPIVAGIRVDALRPEYVRELSRWLRMDPEQVTAAVTAAGTGTTAGTTPARPAQRPHSTNPERDTEQDTATQGPPRPHPQAAPMERETLRLLVQAPHLAVPLLPTVSPTDYTQPAYGTLLATASALLADPATPNGHWITVLRDHATTPTLAALVTELAVEGDRSRFRAEDKVNAEHAARRAFCKVAEDALTRAMIANAHGLNQPGHTPAQQATLIAEGMVLARRKKALRAQGDAFR